MGCDRWLSFGAVCLTLVASQSACSTGRAPEAAQPSAQWISPIARDHPLAGRIYDIAGNHETTQKELMAALSHSAVVLLGEQHDNVDHHRLQARYLAAIVANGVRPAVAFEQLDLDSQPAVDRSLAAMFRKESAAERASALAEAVRWRESGWPPFDEYRPIFEVALGDGLAVRAANLSRTALHDALVRGAAAPSPDAEGWRDVPLSAAQRAAMEADIVESHCGYADARHVAMMVEAQRRRDSAMADAVLAAREHSRDGSVVLVAGFGHARTDYGVPIYLHRRAPGLRAVSVAFVEVIPDILAAAGYADALHAERLPFDYVVFTPRADDTDPCEKFRAGLEKMKAR